MKKVEKVSGTVAQCLNDMYTIVLDNGKILHIPFNVMHKNCDLSSIMSDGKIEDGKRVVLFKKDEQIYYPDLGTYGFKKDCIKPKVKGNPNELKVGVKLFEYAHMDSNEFVNLLSQSLGKLNPITLSKILLIQGSQISECEKQKEIRALVPLPFERKDESVDFERKSSFLHLAGESEHTNEKNGQLREIADCLVAIANSKGQGSMIIGVDDKDPEKVKGVEDEIAELYPQMNRDQFLATVVGNVFHTYIGDPAFEQSLSYDWRILNDHLVCIIDVDYKGDPIVVGNGCLPYKSGSRMSKATGSQMVKLIMEYAKRNMKSE